jgi:Lon protease-like protein
MAVGGIPTGLRCPGEDSNLHAQRAQALNLLRMPIPPPGRYGYYSLFILLVNSNDLTYNYVSFREVIEMGSYELPLFPLRTVLFPGQTLPLHIFEPRYRQMILDCIQADRTFGVVLIREGLEVGGPATPYDVGTTAVIEDIEHLADGRMNIVTVGRERFLLQDYDTVNKPYLVGRISPWPWIDEMLTHAELSQAVQRRLMQYAGLFSQISDTDIELDPSPQPPTALAVLAAVILQVPAEQKQALLEIPSMDELLRRLDQMLGQENRELQIMLASSHRQGEMQHRFSQN